MTFSFNTCLHTLPATPSTKTCLNSETAVGIYIIIYFTQDSLNILLFFYINIKFFKQKNVQHLKAKRPLKSLFKSYLMPVLNLQ